MGHTYAEDETRRVTGWKRFTPADTARRRWLRGGGTFRAYQSIARIRTVIGAHDVYAGKNRNRIGPTGQGGDCPRQFQPIFYVDEA